MSCSNILAIREMHIKTDVILYLSGWHILENQVEPSGDEDSGL